ncbi:hypothetical protein [Deinococcus apachensis]|uniref:hypothetical protein n=1 Tax=Deinococcus apachensis TaxID=309886 RepID=UPI00037047F0|nr:hypothetical protein [Deinococcus apachensis]
MKRLLLACTLVLTACTPALGTLPTLTPSPNKAGATLTLTAEGDHQIVRAGTADATVTLRLYGLKLAVNDPACRAVDAHLECAVGLVPAGKAYGLPARGVLAAEADFVRANGTSDTLKTD